jgi:tripartite-type tricarboxylate transporter receptor subunit TctC
MKPITLARHSLLLAAFVATNAAAQSAYPNKAIRLVVPFTPGGSTDILARAIGNELTQSLGQSVVVENVAGAGGSIGADRVAKANPDGYTLLMGHIGTLGVNPSLYPKLPYDAVKDFAPVAWVARVPNILVVHPGVPANDFKSFMALVKSKPGQYNFGSGGNGSAAHITTEYLKLQGKVSMVHIPYRGTAPSVTDLLAGQI